MDSLITIRRALHKIPEIGFQEVKTQRFLLDEIERLRKPYFDVETWKTGIIVRVAGTEGKITVGWRTDIDALAIEEQTNASFASTHRGYMHACGHDCHMTIALGLLASLSKDQPKNNVIVYFQPAEESPGGAKPMLAYLQQQRPHLLPDYLFACHVAPEYPVGTVATRPGMLFANTSELFIDLEGTGGHAARPHLTKDMTVVAANLILQLQTIVSRNIDPLDSSVVTIGKMTSGVVQNIIAANARLEGTIRTMSAQSMTLIKERITKLCQATELAYDCKVTIDWGSAYYQVWNDETCANKLLAYGEEVEGITPLRCDAAMTGEDFGFFLKEIPGAMFWAGANTPYGLHDARMNPDEAMLDVTVRYVDGFLRNFHL